MAYRISVTDLFYPRGVSATWQGETFATADAAISEAKSMVERDLLRFLNQVGHNAPVVSTVASLMARYDRFAEKPLVRDSDGEVVFDGRGFATLRAEQMVVEARSKPASRRRKRKAAREVMLRVLDLELPRLPRWATQPISSRQAFFGFVGVVIVIAVIRSALGLSR